tara:strand:+ start:863 stop:1267 length:405 start_codon:yes stop_codon:yes gene_type:complete
VTTEKNKRISRKALSNEADIFVDVVVTINPDLLEGLQEKINISFQKLVSRKAARLANEFQFIISNKELLETLTKREREILRLLATGKNNPEIAQCLFISRRTVEEHRKNLNKKLSIKKPIHLHRFAEAFEMLSY